MKQRGRVDEYLAWQHTTIRASASKILWLKVRRGAWVPGPKGWHCPQLVGGKGRREAGLPPAEKGSSRGPAECSQLLGNFCRTGKAPLARQASGNPELHSCLPPRAATSGPRAETQREQHPQAAPPGPGGSGSTASWPWGGSGAVRLQPPPIRASGPAGRPLAAKSACGLPRGAGGDPPFLRHASACGEGAGDHRGPEHLLEEAGGEVPAGEALHHRHRDLPGGPGGRGGAHAGELRRTRPSGTGRGRSGPAPGQGTPSPRDALLSAAGDAGRSQGRERERRFSRALRRAELPR